MKHNRTIFFFLFIFLFWGAAVRCPLQAFAQNEPSVLLDSSNTLSFQNLKFSNPDWLPKNSLITIHQVTLGRPTGVLLMTIEGIEIRIPNSTPITLNGEIRAGIMNLHLRAGRVSLKDLFSRLPSGHSLRAAGGFVTDFSMDITGPSEALKISAEWRMQRLKYERFFLKEALGVIEMNSRKADGKVLWSGHASLQDAFVLFQSAAKAAIKAQSIGLVFKDAPVTDFTVFIKQARLISPSLTAALLYANWRQGLLDANLYFAGIDIQTILKFFPRSNLLKNVSGDISNLDVYVQGDFFQPRVAGSFRSHKLYDKNFSLTEAPGVFGLDFKSVDGAIDVNGEIVFNGGEIYGPNTVAVILDTGRMIFKGDPSVPDLDFLAHAQVEDINIHAGIKGNIHQPDLKLSSDPPRSKEMLLVMLATGRSWQSMTNITTQNAIGSDLAADFIDYFVFGGSGTKMAQQFGIRNISVKIDKDTRGIDFKKDVSDKAAISYGVEQTQNRTGQEPVMTQKVGGEIKLSPTMSLSAEKEIKQEEKAADSQNKQPVADDKIILKYKKEF